MESNQRFIVRRLFAADVSSSSPIPGIIKSVSICWAVRYSSGPHHPPPPPPTFLIVCLSLFDWVRGWQGVTFESVPSSWHPRKARAYKSNETQSSQNHPKDKLLNGDWIPLVLYLLCCRCCRCWWWWMDDDDDCNKTYVSSIDGLLEED